MFSTTWKATLASLVLSLAALVSHSPAALISHWGFDDGAPSQIADDSFSTNDLTLGGTLAVQATDPTWTAASLLGPHALDFDGGDWADIPNNATLATPLITVSAWVKRASGFAGRGREMFAGKGNGGGGGNQTFWIDFEANEGIGFYIHSGGDKYLTTGAGTVANTNWHHILGTYDGSSQRIFLDGVQVASSAFAGVVTTNAHPLLVGKGYTGGGEPFTGTVDDVGLWSHGLPTGQSVALYHLAVTPGLLYNAAQANQLFEVHNAQTGSTMVDGYTWTYATGLGGPLGVPVFDNLNQIFIRLDALGNGVQFLVPEPTSLFLLGAGIVGMMLATRRRASRSAFRSLALAGVLLATFAGGNQADAVLVSHWALDDGAPSQIAADSQSAHPGTLGASVAVAGDDPTWTTSSIVGPWALNFDGSADHVAIPHSPALLTGNQMSVSSWVKRGRNGVREMFVAKGDGNSNATTAFWLEFNGAGNALAFYLSGNAGGAANILTGPVVTDMLDWHHILATYDGSTKRLYVDGLQVGTQALSVATLTNPAFQMAIGKLGSDGLPFQGGIDDTALWSHRLSAGHSAALYHLAVTPGLLYNAAQANQLFEVHNAQAGSTTVNGLTWSYATGLTGPLGIPVFLPNDEISLRLDDLGTGLFFQIPEPSTGFMLAAGVAGVLLNTRRRRVAQLG